MRHLPLSGKRRTKRRKPGVEGDTEYLAKQKTGCEGKPIHGCQGYLALRRFQGDVQPEKIKGNFDTSIECIELMCAFVFYVIAFLCVDFFIINHSNSISNFYKILGNLMDKFKHCYR